MVLKSNKRIKIFIINPNSDPEMTDIILHAAERYTDEAFDVVCEPTPGAPLFIDTTTAGGMTETAPTGTGDCIRVVGYVQTADSIFFNPSPDWFEHA